MFYLVLSTAKDREEAERIGKQLLNEKLVACVNIIPNISSSYWWRGEVESAEEALLLMKTSGEQLDRIFNRVKQLHSYEVPEVLALPIERGAPEYLRWLGESLR